MKRLSTIELFKDYLNFSAGHFTIFSATKRENLHGHNYQLHACITTEVIKEHGLTFDYREYKDHLYELCSELNGLFLLPSQSPFLRIEEQDKFIIAHFNHEEIPFNKRDVKILPLTNITIEELSNWILLQLIANKEDLSRHLIESITIKISSTPGQFASATWSKNDN
jgi:6-pyruvoyltetrahydropterin/6-carboxytetrahydropterin synthase